MGFFGRFVFSKGQWDSAADPSAPFLVVDVHDSDIATIDYSSSMAKGRFYLGYEPRYYFEDPSASAPVDAGVASQGFTAWAQEAVGAHIDPRSVKRLLASPKGRDPKDDFVEETVMRLLTLAGVPIPDGLPIPG